MNDHLKSISYVEWLDPVIKGYEQLNINIELIKQGRDLHQQ